jgi:tetratricopeptide (TPR) repeat protein
MKKMLWFVLFSLLIYGLAADDNAMELFQRYSQDRTQENLFEVVENLTKLMDEDPEDWQIPLLLSYVHYLELNEYIVHLQENLEALPNRVKFQFANLLLSLNQYEQSIEIYDMLTEALPNWSCAWRHKGEALYLAGEPEKAEDSLKEAIRTREEHYDAYVWLALVQKELEKPAEALETLKTGLTYYGKDIEDPDEEVDSMDVQFMLLELYRLNDMQEEYQEKRSKLMQEAPTDTRWDGVKFLSPTH